MDTVRTGQVWRDNNPRKERYIIVVGCSSVVGEMTWYVDYCTCDKLGRTLKEHNRLFSTKMTRFNDTRHGFSLVSQSRVLL